MPTTRICALVPLPVEPLWTQLAEYGTWDTWLQELAESHVEGHDTPLVPVGTTRAVGPHGRPRTRETLVACDSSTRTLKYEVASTPPWRFPARNYLATVHLVELTEQEATVIEWTSRYDCDTANAEYMDELLTGFYRSFIKDLSGKVAERTEPPTGQTPVIN